MLLPQDEELAGLAAEETGAIHLPLSTEELLRPTLPFSTATLCLNLRSTPLLHLRSQSLSSSVKSVSISVFLSIHSSTPVCLYRRHLREPIEYSACKTSPCSSSPMVYVATQALPPR